MTDKKELKENEIEKEIKEDELENVDGGYVFYDRYGSRKWQIIDDVTGNVEWDGPLTKEYAQEWAEKWGLSTEEITWDQLDKIRKEYAAKRAQQLNESQNKK